MDQFHREKIHAFLRIEVVDCRNVGMIELREGQRFAAETFPCWLIGKKPGRYVLSDLLG